MFACPATIDFFRSRLDHMIDLRHPLVVLASRMPWQEIEVWWTRVFFRKGRAGVGCMSDATTTLTSTAGCYAQARQFERMKSTIKRQRTIVGRLQREIECKPCAIGAAVQAALGDALTEAKRISQQGRQPYSTLQPQR